MWIFPLGAAAVSAVFAAQVTQQWMARRRPHQLAWAVALGMFTGASAVVAAGMVGEWSPTLFRTYYLLGAVLNVPFLALGTIYLLAPRAAGHIAAAAVLAASIAATAAVFGATLEVPSLATSGIPRGSEVMPEGVRSISRYYSYTGLVVVAGGALVSALRLARRKEPAVARLVGANLLIAAGTIIVGAASVFIRYGQDALFSVGLLAGVTVMFLGFLKSRPPKT